MYIVGYDGTQFLRKFGHDGTMEWERTFGLGASIEAVAADASGIYVAGVTGIALPGQPSPHGDTERYVARYSPAGSLIWARQFFLAALGDQADRIRTSLLGISSAGVFVAGDGASTSYVRMYDRDGNSQWTRNVPAHLETLSAGPAGAVVISANANLSAPTMRSFDTAGALRFTRPATGFLHTAAPASDGGFFVGYYTYSASLSNRWMVFAKNFSSVKAHVLTLVAKGTLGRPKVDIDAFEVRSTSP